MKLVVFNEGRPGVWTDRGIVDLSRLVLPLGGHDGMCAIIECLDELKRRWPRGVDEVTAADIRAGAGSPGSKSRPIA
jgi:hypothetical protein